MAHFGGHGIEGCACLRILRPACVLECVCLREALYVPYLFGGGCSSMCVVLDPNVWCSRLRHLARLLIGLCQHHHVYLLGPKHICLRHV